MKNSDMTYGLREDVILDGANLGAALHHEPGYADT
jgi:hypothetical protein